MSLNEYQFAKLSPEEKDNLTAAQMRSMVGLVTEEVVAEILGLRAVSTLATWRSRGEGPEFVKLGKGVFYTTESLRVWVTNELNKQTQARYDARNVVQAAA